ncbi:hypothetical protein BDN70DRAFT_818123, partial [Pholiota conissans]
NDAGYHRCVAHRKPYLTKKTVAAHLEWAKANIGRDWALIIFTDEAAIKIGEHPTHQRVTRLPGEEFLLENIEPTFRSGRKSLMVWVAITHNKKGPIIHIEMVPAVINENGKKKGGGMNGKRYVDQILNGPLLRFWQEVEKDRGPGILLVEDGAPAH